MEDVRVTQSKTLYKYSTTSRSSAFQLTTIYVNNIICFSKINAYITSTYKTLVFVEKSKKIRSNMYFTFS